MVAIRRSHDQVGRGISRNPETLSQLEPALQVITALRHCTTMRADRILDRDVLNSASYTSKKQRDAKQHCSGPHDRADHRVTSGSACSLQY